MAHNQSTISTLSLNVKGLRNDRKRKRMYTWLEDHNVHNEITFIQETHSDLQTQAKWNHEWHGKTYYSHGTTHSCGVYIINLYW